MGNQKKEDIENQVAVSFIRKEKLDNPFEGINIFSRVLFFWVFPLIRKAQKKVLTQDDIFNLRDKDLSQKNFEKFNKIFDEIQNDPKITHKIRSTFYRMYKKEIVIVSILYMITVGSMLVNLISIQLLLGAINAPDRGESIVPMLPGIFGYIVTILFSSVIRSNYNFYYSLLTVRMTGALSMKIFQKTFTYPLLRNQYYKIGDILNMIQVDMLQIVTYIQNIIIFVFAFPFMSIALVVASMQLKNMNVILIMVVCASIYIAISFIFGRIYGNLYKNFMHRKDLRMRSLEEMLRGIKTIKYNGLESFFDDRIKEKREKEVQKLRSQNLLQTVNNCINNIVSNAYLLAVAFIVGISTYSEFLLATTSFSILLSYISSLPATIQSIVVGRNSMQRIDNFLSDSYIYERQQAIKSKSQDQIQIGSLSSEKAYSIVLDNANFEWKSSIDFNLLQDAVKLNKIERQSLASPSSSSDVFKIKNLNLKIKSGEFVVFCGDLGSGKSSILQGILGEMEIDGGQKVYEKMVQINGSISICTQEAWIIQDSVRGNIIFGQEYDHQRYKQALHASCFEEDLAYFVDGDQTNIGDKGDTLSGGQKKRINLARSIYKDSDIYFLDDPLSALDISVATFISKSCFHGMLKDKTRIIFVNNLIGMENADRIFLVQKGEVVKEGKYKEIKALLKANGKNDENEELDEDRERRQSSIIMKTKPKQQQPKADEPLTKKLIQEEDVQTGYIKKEVFFEFIKTLGGFKFALSVFIILGGCVILSTFSQLSVADMKNVDNPTQEQKDEQFRSIMVYSLFGIANVVATFAYQTLFMFVMIHLSKTLHKSIVFKLLQGSFTKFYNLITTGRLMNRLSKDIYEVDVLIPRDLSNLMVNLSFLIFSVLMACYLCSMKVIVIIIVYLFIGLFLSTYFLRAKRQAVRIEATSKSPILNYLSEVVRGIFYLRNCVGYEKVRDQFQSSVDTDLRNQIAMNGIQNWFECISTITCVFPLLICGVVTYFDTSISPTSSIMMTQMIQSASASFINISVMWVQFETHMVNYERCLQLKQSVVSENYEGLKNNEERSNSRSESLHSVVSYYAEDNEDDEEEGRPNNLQQTSILFKDASFQYRENLPNCLQNLNIKMEGNQKIGIVGRTGAGKTSITLALTKIVDLVQGSLLINSKSIKKYSLAELRNTISVVSQESYVFEGTLRQNLDPYGIYSDNEIKNVYSLAGFSAFSAFKKGLETEIKQNGDNFSEGEKQVISIARVILRKAKIIIVDEPTSHIDETMETHITKILNDNFKDCLMITIAHKIKTILSSDKIMVIDHGSVIEYDSPQNLLNDSKSQFSNILNLINSHKIN